MNIEEVKNLTIGERINAIRSSLNLSMEKFGKKIGITRSSVNSLEKGVNNPSDQTIKLICKEYNVDYFWLTEGKGNMFLELPDNTIDELIDEYQINPNQKPLIKAYLKSSEETKERLLDFIYGIIKELDNENQ
jgi:transcriptional regulator with XRE-family HTH domain